MGIYKIGDIMRRNKKIKNKILIYIIIFIFIFFILYFFINDNTSNNFIFSNGEEITFEILSKNLCHMLGIDYSNIKSSYFDKYRKDVCNALNSYVIDG